VTDKSLAVPPVVVTSVKSKPNAISEADTTTVMGRVELGLAVSSSHGTVL
jgi:hypothetical protein